LPMAMATPMLMPVVVVQQTTHRFLPLSAPTSGACRFCACTIQLLPFSVSCRLLHPLIPLGSLILALLDGAWPRRNVSFSPCWQHRVAPSLARGSSSPSTNNRL
jgi:hypothetical protein